MRLNLLDMRSEFGSDPYYGRIKTGVVLEILNFLAIQTLVIFYHISSVGKNTNPNTVDKQIFKDNN